MSNDEITQVTLVSSDQQKFVVERKVAELSKIIAEGLEEAETSTYPVANVNGTVLSKVLEYCKYHVAADEKNGNKNDEEVKAWDTDFLKVDTSHLFEIILAANYLNIESLLDKACQAVANMIKGKTPEEIRQKFNIKNDFTPEEEEEVRRENQWAFE